MLSYLSFPRDKRIFPVRTPLYLTGTGMLFAIGDGLWGLTHGSFLYAIHGEGLGQHWTSAMIFDAGVYMAVLGMLSMAIKACRDAGKYVGICGQGPSDHPDLAEWLLDQGIESMSLNPDTVVETWLRLAKRAAD